MTFALTVLLTLVVAVASIPSVADGERKSDCSDGSAVEMDVVNCSAPWAWFRVTIDVSQLPLKPSADVSEVLIHAAELQLGKASCDESQERRRRRHDLVALHSGSSTMLLYSSRWVVQRVVKSLPWLAGGCDHSEHVERSSRRLQAPQVRSSPATDDATIPSIYRLPPRGCLSLATLLPSHIMSQDLLSNVVARWKQELSMPHPWDIHVDVAGILCCCPDYSEQSNHSAINEEEGDDEWCPISREWIDAQVRSGLFVHLEYIEPRKVHNYYTRGRLQTGESFNEPLSEIDGLRGNGYVIGVSDTGIDSDHCFFRDSRVPVPFDRYDPTHRKIVRYKTFGLGMNAKSDFVKGHGTHVVGTVVGSVEDPTGIDAGSDSLRQHGLVPQAKVSFADLSASSAEGIQSIPVGTLLQLVAEDGASVMSNSWGAELGSYTANAASVDTYVHDIKPSMVVIFSAGNEADNVCKSSPKVPLCDRYTVMSPSTSKNGLSVGSSLGTQDSWDHADLGNYRLHISWTTTVNSAVLDQEYSDFVIKGAAGPNFPKTPIEGSVVMSSPPDLCSTPSNGEMFRDAIVLAVRGTCAFTDKTQRAITYGATAVIILNHLPGYGIIMGCPDDVCVSVSINSFMASLEFGQRLTSLLSRPHDGNVRGSIVATEDPMPDHNPETLSSFSSHGPTRGDLRYKPDLVAVGEMLHSARSDADLNSNNCDFWASQGTSMATPLVAGLSVMVLEYLQRVHSPPIVSPSSALVKAVLIQSARPLTGRYERNFAGDWRPLGQTPNFEEGHGFPVLNRTLPVHSNTGVVETEFWDDIPLALGDVHQYHITFNGKVDAFEATLVWVDPAASPSESLTLINNLDIRVHYTVRIGSNHTVQRTRHGNAFTHVGDVSRSAFSVDVVNNAEKVTLVNALEGEYVVEVLGTRIVTPSQKYSLVVSGIARNTNEPVECPASYAVQSNEETRQPCGSRGRCLSNGVCDCFFGWTGPSCSTPSAVTLTQGQQVTSEISPMHWAYYAIKTAASSPADNSNPITVTVTHNNSMADVDIIICSFPPNYTSFFLSDPSRCFAQNREQDNAAQLTSSPSPAIVRTLSFAPATEASETYFVGVFGMCCYPVVVTVSMTEGKSIYASPPAALQEQSDAPLRLSVVPAPPEPAVSQTTYRGFPMRTTAVAPRRDRVTSSSDVHAVLRRSDTYEALAICRSEALPLTSSGSGDISDTDLSCEAKSAEGFHFLCTPGTEDSFFVILEYETEPGRVAAVPSQRAVRQVSCRNITATLVSEAPPVSSTPTPSRNASFLPNTFSFVQNPDVCILPNLHWTGTGCQFDTSIMVPNAATGVSFYGEDPPIAPTLWIWWPMTPTNGAAVTVTAHLTDGNGTVISGIDAWSTDLSCGDLQRLEFGTLSPCTVTGVAAQKQYMLTFSTLEAGGQMSNYDATNMYLWVSPSAVVTALSLLPYTRFANPMVVSYPNLNAVNQTVYIQGAYFLPHLGHFASVQQRLHVLSQSVSNGGLTGSGALNVTFRSPAGDYDDMYCVDAWIMSPSLIRCTVPAFPVAPQGTSMILEVRSTVWYALVIGLVEMQLSPRPTITGAVVASGRTTAVPSLDVDGSITLVGVHFPVSSSSSEGDDDSTRGEASFGVSLGIVASTGSSSSSMTRTPLTVLTMTSTRLVAALPYSFLVSLSQDTVLSAGVLESSLDFQNSISVGETRTEDSLIVLYSISVLRSATTPLTEPSKPYSTSVLLDQPAAYIAIFGANLHLATSWRFGLKVNTTSGVDASSISSSPFAQVSCQYEEYYSRRLIPDSNNKKMGYVACRVSPFALLDTAYHLRVYINEHESSLASPFQVTVANTSSHGGMSSSSHSGGDAVQPPRLLQAEGIPILVGAPTFFTVEHATESASMYLSSTTTCDPVAPLPCSLDSVVSTMDNEGNPLSMTFMLTAHAVSPISMPCFTSGPLMPSIDGFSPDVDIGNIFYAPLVSADAWTLPSVMTTRKIQLQQNSSSSGELVVNVSVIGDMLPLPSTTTSGSLVVDWGVPVRLSITMSDFTAPPPVDENDIPFFVYLGGELEDPLHPFPVTVDDDTNSSVGGVPCNASRVVIYGQSDSVTDDNHVFVWESLNLASDVFLVSSSPQQQLVQGMRGRLCIEVSQQQSAPNLMPVSHFASIGMVAHGVSLSTSSPLTASPVSSSSPVPVAELSCVAWGTERQLSDGTCVCKEAFRGSDCSKVCPINVTSGVSCNGRGVCLLSSDNSGTHCVCSSLFAGHVCERYRQHVDVIATTIATEESTNEILWAGVPHPSHASTTTELFIDSTSTAITKARQRQRGCWRLAVRVASTLPDAPCPAVSSGGLRVVFAIPQGGDTSRIMAAFDGSSSSSPSSSQPETRTSSDTAKKHVLTSTRNAGGFFTWRCDWDNDTHDSNRLLMDIEPEGLDLEYCSLFVAARWLPVPANVVDLAAWSRLSGQLPHEIVNVTSLDDRGASESCGVECWAMYVVIVIALSMFTSIIVSVVALRWQHQV